MLTAPALYAAGIYQLMSRLVEVSLDIPHLPKTREGLLGFKVTWT